MIDDTIPPDDRRDYAALVEKAVGETARAGNAARQVRGDAQAVAVAAAQSAAGIVAAVLAVADRLDVLIGAAFDERRPIAVVEHESHEEEGGSHAE